MNVATHRGMDAETEAALLRLLEVAYRDTGQSRRVASFLLAWWNATTCGGFDLTDLWGLDQGLREDIVRLFAFVTWDQHYPDTLGWSREFGIVLRRWRPHLLEPTTNAAEADSSGADHDEPTEHDLPEDFVFPIPEPADEEDPDVVMARLVLSAEHGDRDAAEFLELFERWERTLGASFVRTKDKGR